MEVIENRKKTECKILIKDYEKSDLEKTWEKKAKAYNSMFIFLKEKGLNEKDLTKFGKLFREYIELI